MLFTEAAPTYNHINSVQEFCFLHISLTLVISYLFDNNHHNRYAVISHGYDLCFPSD